MQSHKYHYALIVLLLWMAAVAGCTGHLMPAKPAAKPVAHDDFIIVTAAAGDTWASLARHHLGNRDRARQLRAFNNTDEPTPGRQVVIPRKPMDLGGLRANGYQTVPVLVYTRLAASPTNAHTVSVRQFREHIRYIYERGFTTVSLDWLHDFSNFKVSPPPKAVVISFDTTQRWVYQVAYPMLKERGMRAALFVRTMDIGKKDRLTWEQLSEMASAGFDIGILGKTPDVSASKDRKAHLKAVEADLTAPRVAFQKHLKARCRYYAYPKGKDDDLIIALLKKHGFRSAFTRIRGSNPFFMDDFKIKRSVIYGHYKMDQFGRSLSSFQKADLQ